MILHVYVERCFRRAAMNVELYDDNEKKLKSRDTNQKPRKAFVSLTNFQIFNERTFLKRFSLIFFLRTLPCENEELILCIFSLISFTFVKYNKISLNKNPTRSIASVFANVKESRVSFKEFPLSTQESSSAPSN